MKIEKIDEDDRYEYKKLCDCCDLEIMILTQKDSFPEYYTRVYLQCSCGNFVEFVLPVN